MQIRDEHPADERTIADLVLAAFTGHSYSNQREHRLIDALRAANALTLSLVAAERDEIRGHIAFSPVWIDGRFQDWYGLGPVAVRPQHQRRGIGGALIKTGLARLRALGAQGCVLVGDSGYYRRFGFTCDPRLTYADLPAAYFMALPFGSSVPAGAVTFHPAFAALS